MAAALASCQCISLGTATTRQQRPIPCSPVRRYFVPQRLQSIIPRESNRIQTNRTPSRPTAKMASSLLAGFRSKYTNRSNTPNATAYLWKNTGIGSPRFVWLLCSSAELVESMAGAVEWPGSSEWRKMGALSSVSSFISVYIVVVERGNQRPHIPIGAKLIRMMFPDRGR